MNNIALYLKLAGARIASQMQYPFSFYMGVLLTFLASFIDVIGLLLIFDRFKMIKGWSLAEICLLYGILHSSFALVEMVARGFDTFGRLIRSGQLDRILVRPRGIALQVLGQEFRTANIGRFLQGLLPLIYALVHLQLEAVTDWLVLALAFVISIMTFFCLLLIQATLSFWAQDSLEIMNAFVYGGMQAGQLPMSVYDKWVVRFFAFIVPIALCSYYPVLVILGRPDLALGLNPLWVVSFSPIWVSLLLFGATRFFRYGIRRYTSTG